MQKTITRWGVKLSFLFLLGLVAPSTAHAQFGLGKLLNKVTDALDKVGDALGVEGESPKHDSSSDGVLGQIHTSSAAKHGWTIIKKGKHVGLLQQPMYNGGQQIASEKLLLPAVYQSIVPLGEADFKPVALGGNTQVFHLLLIQNDKGKWGVYDLNNVNVNPWLATCDYALDSLSISRSLLGIAKNGKWGGFVKVSLRGKDSWQAIPAVYESVAGIDYAPAYLARANGEKQNSIYSPSGDVLLSNVENTYGVQGSHLRVRKDGKYTIYKYQGALGFKEVLGGIDSLTDMTVRHVVTGLPHQNPRTCLR